MYYVSCLPSCRILGDPWDTWPGKDIGVPRCCCIYWLCFSGLMFSQHSGTPPGQCSLLLWVSPSLSVQGIILTRLAVLLTGGRSFHFLSPFLCIQSTSMLFLFKSRFPMSPSHIIKQEGVVQLWGNLYFCCRLKWALALHLCLAVMLFFVQQCTVLTKTKLDMVYVCVPDRA